MEIAMLFLILTATPGILAGIGYVVREYRSTSKLQGQIDKLQASVDELYKRLPPRE